MPTSTRRTLIAAALTTTLAVSFAGQAVAGPDDVPGTAGAATLMDLPEEDRPEFYEPPAELPAAGSVIRSMEAPLKLDPLGVSRGAVTSTRLMYASTDGKDRSTAITGTLFEPTAPWIKGGERPVISYAVGTVGMADGCAPSRQLEEGFLLESIFIGNLINAGYAVVVTDYQGLGTPGTHTYMDREAQGRAVLDAARAAKNLPESGLNDKTPVGIIGYSQGGGASAAAAELAGTYAPDLDVKAAVAGAVPADLGEVGKALEGGKYAGFLFFATIGNAMGGNIDLKPYLNAEGRTLAGEIEGSCVDALGEFEGMQSKDYTKDGRPLTEYLSEEPFKSVVEGNRVGNRKPSVPVLVTHSKWDDTIPYEIGTQLKKDWCEQGAPVKFETLLIPTHVGGVPGHSWRGKNFFDAAFAGKDLRNDC